MCPPPSLPSPLQYELHGAVRGHIPSSTPLHPPEDRVPSPGPTRSARCNCTLSSASPMQSATKSSPPKDSTVHGSMHNRSRARSLPPPFKSGTTPFTCPTACCTHLQPYHLHPLTCPTPTVAPCKFHGAQKHARHPASPISSLPLLGENQHSSSLPPSAASMHGLSRPVTTCSGSHWPLPQCCGVRGHALDHPHSLPLPPPPDYYVPPSDIPSECCICAQL
jgi:hypothetical protein